MKLPCVLCLVTSLFVGCGIFGTDFEVNRRAKIRHEAYMKAHPDYVLPEEYSMFGPLPDKR